MTTHSLSAAAVIIASVVLVMAGRLSALDRDSDLFPFGTQHGDNRMEVGDDVSSDEIQLETQIAFYDNYYTSIFVNLNGALSFDDSMPEYHSDVEQPSRPKIIAPFLADVDTRLSGNVYYRETGDQSLKDKMSSYISAAFPDFYEFYPETLFIATWEDVGHYNRKYDLTNTFQVVIASDGRESFVAFLYPDDGLTWTRGDGKVPGQLDVPGQALFDAGDDRRHYFLPGSGTTEVTELTLESNTNFPGLWLFRVGYIGDDGDIELPSPAEGHNEIDLGTDDSDTDVPDETEDNEAAPLPTDAPSRPASSAGSCSRGGDRTCHSNARCTDYPQTGGYCCECAAPFIGNGRECIRTDEAQRISGKVSGRVNGVDIDSVDLHAYVVTTDGRTYTAISRIPTPIGYSLQGLYVIGSVLGFMFALPQQPSVRNGFMITGGQFNRTAVLQFSSTGDTLTIRQTFVGQDAQGHMQMTTVLDGTAPEIDPEAKVEVDEYQEEYRRISAGVLKSSMTHNFRANSENYRFTLDQTIQYTECAYRPLTDLDVIRIGVTRNFVVYAGTEQIVRFSQTNKVISAAAGGDPCREARCDPNADCVPQRDSYQCICRSGFEGTGQRCRDINECQQVPGACDSNAECYNSQGSYECRCYPGYSGDGRTCRAEGQSCDILRNCHRNARCEYDEQTGSYYCQCENGYEGDGYQCTLSRPERDCNSVSGLCDGNAQCQYDPQTRRYGCRCNRGYDGNGQTCQRIDCRRDPTVCDPNARCERRGTQYACACKFGYQGDGFECSGSRVTITNSLIYAQGMYIMNVPFNPTDANPGGQTLYIPGQTAIGIDVDCLSNYIYWTDVSGKTISRAKLDGTDSEVFLRDLGSPEGVAVDWISKNIYWTDSGRDRIDVVRFDGTSRKNLVTDGLVNPRAIVVDPIRGLMFWTDWNREAPKIERANMDGTERRTLVSDGLGLPNGLTIDYETTQVCWADAGTHKVECVSYDGRGRRTINQSAGYPFGLAFGNGNLYWTDWERQTLPNVNKMLAQTPNEDLNLPLGANGRLYGVTAVKGACPSGTNPCSYNNGGCRFLCLPSSKGGRTCTCPDDIEPEECNRISLL